MRFIGEFLAYGAILYGYNYFKTGPMSLVEQLALLAFTLIAIRFSIIDPLEAKIREDKFITVVVREGETETESIIRLTRNN